MTAPEPLGPGLGLAEPSQKLIMASGGTRSMSLVASSLAARACWGVRELELPNVLALGLMWGGRSAWTVTGSKGGLWSSVRRCPRCLEKHAGADVGYWVPSSVGQRSCGVYETMSPGAGAPGRSEGHQVVGVCCFQRSIAKFVMI